MGNRRRSREFALQALCDMDMNKDDSAQRFNRFCKNFNPPQDAVVFSQMLVNGVVTNKSEIDKQLDDHSTNWKLSRMSFVDRNTLRMALFEMLHCKDIPFKVSINEAIDLGKKFGTEESGAFINGILDSIRIAVENNPDMADKIKE